MSKKIAKVLYLPFTCRDSEPCDASDRKKNEYDQHEKGGGTNKRTFRRWISMVPKLQSWRAFCSHLGMVYGIRHLSRSGLQLRMRNSLKIKGVF